VYAHIQRRLSCFIVAALVIVGGDPGMRQRALLASSEDADTYPRAERGNRPTEMVRKSIGPGSGNIDRGCTLSAGGALHPPLAVYVWGIRGSYLAQAAQGRKPLLALRT